MIGIADYGLGNITAFEIAYKRLGVPTQRLRSAEDFDRADRVILPGVGAFDMAMERLSESGLYQPLLDFAESGKPLLGICVGMQMLANSSEEGSRPGLGLISGVVRKFPSDVGASGIRCPHMGWNAIRSIANEPVLEGLDRRKFYFLHSYYFDANLSNQVVGVADYEIRFDAVVKQGNVIGAQFHPEKSHEAGLMFLSNFASYTYE